ncbi:MAG: 4-alpha-glucanotransferase [Anaerolineae bacterium]|nr:4-alpha-glucanotransferase [Anaerolineae bacterium]NUQ02879.1 4-alpha-glucanotransferase [Anaerolineae bacterium]
MTLFPRASGILLHPTSLPGRYGIGDLGAWAYKFVDWLHSAHQSIWQVLPLGPTSYGDSPYQALSAMAGNPNLISLDMLIDVGWLSQADVADKPPFPEDHVDFGWIIPWRAAVLRKAYDGFARRASKAHVDAFRAWGSKNAHWLEDYALFMALKNAHGGKPWTEWDEALALRDRDALIDAEKRLGKELDLYRFQQWVFAEQWAALRAYTHSKGIRFVGDIPIFVAHDSSDVWANPHLFALDPKGKPITQAGVPPDYFSEDGQLWGNPHYRWEVMAKDGYHWWIRRFQAQLEQVDLLRIDHFRGFEGYWAVPGSARTARVGEWIKGPGLPFFRAVESALGALPIIAEDLGVITPEVDAIRLALNLPGMKVLQFAFGESTGDAKFLPHNHVENCIVYTGTHDNNTTFGWYITDESGDEARDHLMRYVDRDYRTIEPHWDMIRLAWASVGHTAVTPLQDILGLGREARMNTPGKPYGNWQWRFTPDMLEGPARGRLAALTRLYDRAEVPHT